MDVSNRESSAPGVVALMVTRDPGPFFDEALSALASQDYTNLSILVLVAPGGEDLTDRIASAAPGAFVRRLTHDRGFGAAINDAAELVEGATFLALCHDDAILDPDAISIMVENSFRMNAGVVTPKMVRYDDPRVLLHVGQSVDKTGAVIERVQPTERDVGQHDAVRQVFCAPGGATLIRADLFAALGGFDEMIVAMGEDLDLSWRAHIAGARVVVAPGARVRHIEMVASGQRSVARRGRRPQPSLQELQRRHELRTVLSSYSLFHLLRVLPQVLILLVAEVIAAMAVGDRARASAIVGALRWNLSHFVSLLGHRRAAQKVRAVSDREVRRLQVRGSARLSTYISKLTHLGLEAAHGLEQTPAEALLTGSLGTTFSDDDSFDQLDDLGRRSGRDRFGRRPQRRIFASRRSRALVWLVAVIVILIGLRGLLGGALPQFGQFAPFPSWTGAWHQMVSSWQASGFGTTSPSSPAYGLLGLAGTFLLGHMGTLQRIILLGALPVGGYGVSRLLRPFASVRASFAGALAYLGLPLYFNALAQGRLDGVVLYALAPWLFVAFARVVGFAPFDVVRSEKWSETRNGRVLLLALLEAVGIAFAPATIFVIVALVVGAVGAGWMAGPKIDARAVLARVGVASALALALVGPWLIGAFASGGAIVTIFGHAASSSNALSFEDIARFAIGPVGTTPVTWALLVAALLPLFVCREERQAWLARLWLGGLFAWALAFVSQKGWMAPFAPVVSVVLIPAALAVAVSIGLGVAAFDHDLPVIRFGWRQFMAPLAVLALAVGIAPVVPEALNGRFDTPSVGYNQALSVLVSPATHGDYRVLWLGDPNALPQQGWSVGPGLSFAISDGNTLGGSELLAAPGAGPAGTVSNDVRLALRGATVNLGHLLASSGIRYIAFVTSVAPDVPGVQSPPSYTSAPGLLRVLRLQDDLTAVSESDGGIYVFQNAAAIPQWGARSKKLGGLVSEKSVAPNKAAIAGWLPILRRSSDPTTGVVRSGVVYHANAPASAWVLAVNGVRQRRIPAFGWASQYEVSTPGVAALTQDAFPWGPIGGSVLFVLWAAAILALWPRRRLIDRYWAPLRERLIIIFAPLIPIAVAIGRAIWRATKATARFTWRITKAAGRLSWRITKAAGRLSWRITKAAGRLSWRICVALFALLPPSVKELTAKKVGILFVSGARSVGKSSLAGAKSAARKTKAAHAQRKSESKNQVQDEETAP